MRSEGGSKTKRRRVGEEDGQNLSPVRDDADDEKEDRVVALLCGDLHISHKAPVARSAEEDWYEAQARPFIQLNRLVRQYDVPVICSGDVFDRWNVPPETINFALKYLPTMYAVPGQHDLPHHNYGDIKRSAFWTLVEADKIILLDPQWDCPMEIATNDGHVRLWGFPFGCEIVPLKQSKDLYLEIAVVHQYLWKDGCGYQGAPEDKRVGKTAAKLKGYDIAAFGDNHTPFEHRTKSGCLVYNCGGFQCRKTDERGHSPSVGMLHASGKIVRHYLDTSKDVYISSEWVEDLADGIGMNSFLEELAILGDCAINFSETVHRIMEREKTSPAVKSVVLRALQEGS